MPNDKAIETQTGLMDIMFEHQREQVYGPCRPYHGLQAMSRFTGTCMSCAGGIRPSVVEVEMVPRTPLPTLPMEVSLLPKE